MNAAWTAEDTAVAPSPEPALKIERETHKLEKRLCRLTGQAIVDYNMVEQGDKVMVCMSGGKDSYAMLGVRVKIAKLEIFDDCEVAIRVEAGQW